MKSRSERYYTNRPNPRHGHEYANYKMCLSIVMVICIKQHLLRRYYVDMLKTKFRRTSTSFPRTFSM